jgi:hypothetical protein
MGSYQIGLRFYNRKGNGKREGKVGRGSKCLFWFLIVKSFCFFVWMSFQWYKLLQIKYKITTQRYFKNNKLCEFVKYLDPVAGGCKCVFGCKDCDNEPKKARNGKILLKYAKFLNSLQPLKDDKDEQTRDFGKIQQFFSFEKCPRMESTNINKHLPTLFSSKKSLIKCV